MRLFAGIPVPQPARSQVAAILGGLQAHHWPVRWVRPEGLHLTLKFFGSVPEETAAQLVPALAQASDGTGPIPLTCAGIGSFPAGQRARVIWIGVDAPGALELLQDAVERACVPLGFPVEGRPFRPHITLGRVKDGEKLPAHAIEDAAVEPEIPFLADQLVLFQSQPGRSGSVYHQLHTFALSPCAAA
jgi:2'-5' RNA ligase